MPKEVSALLTEKSRPYFGLIAAAGLSSRMGQSKALMKNPQGQTFISHLVQGFMASGCQQLWVTLPNDDKEANQIRFEVLNESAPAMHGAFHFQKNRFEDLGFMGSIWSFLDERSKILSSQRNEAKAGTLSSKEGVSADFPQEENMKTLWPLLFCPVDLPVLDSKIARKLVEATENHLAVVPTYNGRSGHPVACAASLFPRLRKQQEGGARALFEKIKVGTVEVLDENIVKNVNTPAELRAFFQKAKG